MKEEEKKIYESLASTIHELGYDLVEVRLSGGKNKTMNVVVDRVKPISLEDIVAVSEKVSERLDELDPVEGAYTLDVSSLGAEKPIDLAKLPSYVGNYVNLHLSTPYKGENILEGTLLEATEETLTLQIKVKAAKKSALLQRKDVDKARLAIEL